MSDAPERLEPKMIGGQIMLARDKDGGYVTWDDYEALRKENERLREALASVIAACDQGRMMPRPGSGVGGMTIEANIRSSIYTGVPAWPVEEARAALQGETD